uniref:Uncharacterized protein n=1 Tax=Rhizophora mucronata TaxID=61149 RepID=A0A2P2Q327_RHIMU
MFNRHSNDNCTPIHRAV